MKTKDNGATVYPKYQSHKIVEAFKIKEIKYDSDIAASQSRDTDGSALLVPEDDSLHPLRVNKEYISKHKPQEGGYWVRYKDGYESWSPADEFEGGNTLITD